MKCPSWPESIEDAVGSNIVGFPPLWANGGFWGSQLKHNARAFKPASPPPLPARLFFQSQFFLAHLLRIKPIGLMPCTRRIGFAVGEFVKIETPLANRQQVRADAGDAVICCDVVEVGDSQDNADDLHLTFDR